MAVLAELTVPDNQVTILPTGQLQVREATFITRDGAIDPAITPKYHRYIINPGDDLTGKADRIAAIAAASWTPELIATFRDALAAAGA